MSRHYHVYYTLVDVEKRMTYAYQMLPLGRFGGYFRSRSTANKWAREFAYDFRKDPSMGVRVDAMMRSLSDEDKISAMVRQCMSSRCPRLKGFARA